jgi:cell wall-associated NlpC family hydrolase
MGHKAFLTAAFVAASAAMAPAFADDAAKLEALAAVGKPYVRGGDTLEHGFDCSGLVFFVYRAARGITLPRSVAGLRHAGKPVSRAELQPGDLLFYNTRKRPYSHVAIYIGGGRFVHAPRPGARVRIERADSSYWRARFDGARRIDAGI